MGFKVSGLRLRRFSRAFTLVEQGFEGSLFMGSETSFYDFLLGSIRLSTASCSFWKQFYGYWSNADPATQRTWSIAGFAPFWGLEGSR